MLPRNVGNRFLKPWRHIPEKWKTYLHCYKTKTWKDLLVCVCVCVCVLQTLSSWTCVFGISTFRPISLSLFQPFVTDADESGWDYTAGQLASPTVLLLCRSLSARWSSVTEGDCFRALWNKPHPFDHLMRCLFPKSWGSCSLPGQSLWVLWRTLWQWDRLFSEYTGCPRPNIPPVLC